MTVPDSVYALDFSIDRDFQVMDATKLIYLELDSRCDPNLEYRVYMESSRIRGANTERADVMAIRGSEDWVHLYVNLGRTWAYFNYNPDFRISFTAIKTGQTGGEVRMDNVRLLTTSVVL